MALALGVCLASGRSVTLASVTTGGHCSTGLVPPTGASVAVVGGGQGKGGGKDITERGCPQSGEDTVDARSLARRRESDWPPSSSSAVQTAEPAVTGHRSPVTCGRTGVQHHVDASGVSQMPRVSLHR